MHADRFTDLGYCNNSEVMALLNSIPGIDQILHQKVVVERKSYQVVSLELREAYPRISRGLSSRSVRRYCSENGIHGTSRLTDTELDRLVSSSVSMV